MKKRLTAFRQRIRQKGAALVESLIALPIIIMLGLGGAEWAHIYEAKTTLDHAAVQGARAGAINNAKVISIQRGISQGMLTLYSPKTGDAILTQAKVVALAATQSRLRILNPTPEAFADFGVTKDGRRVLPNDNLMQRSTAVGATSGINIQDANLLKIETTWGVELRMPFISQIISLIGKQISPIASFDYYLYSRGMIPVTSTTVVRMQSEAWENSSMVSIKKLDTERTQNGPEEQLVTHSGSLPWGSNGSSGGYDGSLASSYVSGFNPNSHWDNSSGNDDVGNNFDEGNGSDSGSDEDTGDEDADPDPEGPDTGPTCDTNWDDEKYQKQELECDGWFCENIGQQFQEFKEDLRVALNIVGDFIAGVYQGMVNQVEDLVELFSDPTVLIDIAKAFIDDPVGTLEGIVDSVVEDAETVMECGPYDIGRILGENMSPAVALKVVTKLSKISGNAKLAKYADELEQDIACASFPAGTQIWTPDGPVAIETLSVGDSVLSRSTHNFQTHPQTVTHQLNRTAEGYQQITTEFGTLTVTPEHPFWVQGRGWTEAKNLQPEDPIATEEGDTLILENRVIEKPVKVYNLSVENTPSYFAGESKAWVHNATCTLPGSKTVEFEKSLVNLPSGERVARVSEAARDFASQNGWSRAKQIERKNPGRTVYSDGKGSLYSLDTQHGRWEKVNAKNGKHISEVYLYEPEIYVPNSQAADHGLNIK